MVTATLASRWTCRSCVEREAGCNLPAELGMWSDPPSPDAICCCCGERPSESVRLRLTFRQFAERAHAVASKTPSRRNTVAGLISARSAAAKLGIGRDTLTQLVSEKKIERVPKGKGWGYRSADVEAMIDGGFVLGERSPRGAQPRPARPRPRKSRATATPAARSITDLPF